MGHNVLWVDFFKPNVEENTFYKWPEVQNALFT